LLGHAFPASAQGAYTPPANPVAGGPPPPANPPANAAPGGVAAIPPSWTIVPSIEVGETYNDNVNLTPKGTEAWDVITTVSPGVRISGQTQRFNLAATYNPQGLIFARNTSDNTVQERLLGTARAEVIREALFVETSGSMDQEFVRATGPIANTTLTTNSNLQTVTAGSASPYLLQHAGSYFDSETRYRFSTVSTSGGAVAPQQINEARQVFTSGPWFDRLAWHITGDWTKIDRLTGTSDPLGGTSGKDELAGIDLKYRIYAGVSLIGGAAYEKIIDQTLGFEPNGPVWNAGFAYEPNPYLALSATYGRRFERSDIGANARYTPSPDLVFRGVYAQSIQTTPAQIAGNLNQVTVGPDGTLVNSQTGLPVTVNTTTVGATNPNSVFGIISGAFLEKRFEADIDVTRERNTYHASAYHVRQSGQAAVLSSERIVGGSLGWTRQLRPELNSIVVGAYDKATFEDGTGRIDNTYFLSIALTYTISRTASARVSLSRSDTDSNSPGNSIVNDLVMISLRKEF